METTFTRSKEQNREKEDTERSADTGKDKFTLHFISCNPFKNCKNNHACKETFQFCLFRNEIYFLSKQTQSYR
jgi:hypothetical protein